MIFEKISRWENSRWENFQSQMKLLNLEEVASRSARNITEEEHRANWKLLSAPKWKGMRIFHPILREECAFCEFPDSW